MRAVTTYKGSVYIMGRRFEGPVVGLAGAVFLVSVIAALLPAIGALFWLTPQQAWAGEIWRFVTWPLISRGAIPLVFGIFAILFLGNDLCQTLGPARFLRLALGPSLVTGILISLFVMLLAPPQFGAMLIVGDLVLLDTMIIAWATYFPERPMLVYFVIPMSGQTLIYGTIGITVLMAIFDPIGPLIYIPQFLAQALTLAYLHRPAMPWLRGRFQRSAPVRRTHLRAVPRDDAEEPPRWVH
jgi:membrane associated rhomboid family serine protease